MKTPSDQFSIRSPSRQMSRERALKLNAVEGLAPSPTLAAMFAGFDRDELSGDERRAALRAQFVSKR